MFDDDEDDAPLCIKRRKCNPTPENAKSVRKRAKPTATELVPVGLSAAFSIGCTVDSEGQKKALRDIPALTWLA